MHRRAMQRFADDPPAAVRGFITGMSRSGTTWLGKCLNEHPDVVVIGETKYWGRSYVEPGADGQYGREQLNRIIDQISGGEQSNGINGLRTLRLLKHERTREVLEGAMEHLRNPTPGRVFSALCATVAEVEGKKYVIEKTPHHVNWLDRITQALPRTRFVVLYREPYTFMLSYKHQGDRKSARRRQFYERFYHPAGCAVVWRGYASGIRKAVERHGDHVLVISQKEIEVAPEAVLERVQRHFGLTPADLTAPRHNTSFPDGARPELAADDVFWMNLIAGREMRRHGIRTAPVTPAHTGLILKSIARVPKWGTQMLALMRREYVTGGTVRYLWRWLRPGG